MTLRERVALLLYQQLLPLASAEDAGQIQRAIVVVPAEILIAAGDLLELHGLITDRFDNGGFARRLGALQHLIEAIDYDS